MSKNSGMNHWNLDPDPDDFGGPERPENPTMGQRYEAARANKADRQAERQEQRALKAAAKKEAEDRAIEDKAIRLAEKRRDEGGRSVLAPVLATSAIALAAGLVIGAVAMPSIKHTPTPAPVTQRVVAPPVTEKVFEPGPTVTAPAPPAVTVPGPTVTQTQTATATVTVAPSVESPSVPSSTEPAQSSAAPTSATK